MLAWQSRRFLVDLQVWFAAMLIFGLLGSTSYFYNFLGFISFRIIAPVSHAAISLQQPFLNWYDAVSKQWPLVYEYQRLKLDYANVLGQLAQMQGVVAENKALKEQLDLGTIPTDEQIGVPVLSYTQPLVTIGETSQVEFGDLVTVAGVLVGFIHNVHANQAEVRLLADPASQPLVVVSDSGADGVMYGAGKELVVRELSPSHPIAVGELVRTVGQPGVPADLAIGRVVSVKETQAGSKEAVINQEVSFYDVKLVKIKTIK